MKIETKHSINDSVYLLYDSKVVQGTIIYINYSIRNNGGNIEESTTYTVTGISGITTVNKEENKLFSTKEELIKSL